MALLPACTVVGLVFNVTTTVDGSDAAPGDSACEVAAGAGDCSLRAAIDESNAQSGVQVTVSVPAGTYTLGGGVDDTNQGGDLDINRNVTVAGTAGVVVIDAAGNDRAIDNRAVLKLSAVTVRNGRSAEDGGGVRNIAGSLELIGSTVSNNASGGSGGGIAVVSGSAVVTRSTISSNTARAQGAGIQIGPGASASLTNSTVSTNAVDPVTPIAPSSAQSSAEAADPAVGPASTMPADADTGVGGPTVPPPPTPERPEGSATVPVIVELDVDTAPESTLTSTEVADQRRRIAATRAATVRGAGIAGTVRRSYSTLPYLALDATLGDLAKLASSGSVRHIQPDSLDAPSLAQSLAWINADDVHAAGDSGAGSTVAILDSGIDLAHPMFAGKVVSEACFAQGATYGDAAGDCPNGTPTQAGAGGGVNCPYLGATCWHGTHVAGIAAGEAFTSGGTTRTGVAPGASIISVQVFSHFTGESSCGTGRTECIKSYVSDQLAALDFVYTQRANFDIASVNMSLGGGSYTSACDSDSRKAAIDNLKAAGIATVIASGNDGIKSSIAAPACISTAVSVGATGDDNDLVASFSNSSATLLDLLAPGVSITSAYPGGTTATANGTSMATPHVAGSFAVLHRIDPVATVDALLSGLQAGGVLVTDSANGVTKPRVDLASAVGAIGGAGRGGGIANHGSLTLTYTTVTDNVAAYGAGLATSSSVSLAATVIASQTSGKDCAIDGTGSTTSSGFNVASDGSCALEAASDLGATSVQLGSLTNNGGPTATHLPAVGSPLIDLVPIGTASLCTGAVVDQRGTARPQGSGCDAGAVDR